MSTELLDFRSQVDDIGVLLVALVKRMCGFCMQYGVLNHFMLCKLGFCMLWISHGTSCKS